MVQSHFVKRTVPMTACAAAVLLSAAGASGKESKRAVCTAAYSSYKSGVQNEKAGHLREAREQYSSCAEVTVCGGLAPKCKAAYDKIAVQMPSVVPVVTDANGAPRLDVEVRADGQLLCSHLDGKGLPIDAGAHEFTFAADGRVFATQKVLVVEGERNRRVTVSAQDIGSSRPAPAASKTAAAPPPDERSTDKTADSTRHDEASPSAPAREEASTAGGAWALPKSPIPYVIGGAGVAGVLGGVLLTYWGNKDNDQAVAQCNHSCPQSTADHIKTMYLAADISFGVGVVGLGVATFLIATSHAKEEKPEPKAAYVFDVQPTRSGALATVKGSF